MEPCTYQHPHASYEKEKEEENLGQVLLLQRGGGGFLSPKLASLMGETRILGAASVVVVA